MPLSAAPTATCRLLFTLTCILTTFRWGCVLGQQDETARKYSLFEETPSNTFIADIRQGAGLKEELGDDVFPTLRYAILPQSSTYSSYFTIDETTAVLRTAEKIDRDEICRQQVTCQIRIDVAIQPREYFRIIKIVVEIDDTNDNPPKFIPGNYNRDVPENTQPGASFAIPTADDPDSPKFGVKRYDLISGAPEFALKVTNNTDGSVDLHLVLKEKVDRETRELYRVVVAAYDGGPQANSGFLTIDVSITDINDNTPEFDNDTYQVTIPEDVAKDTVIIRVRARDVDAGVNGRVLYGFSPKTEQAFGQMFAINNATGEISVKDRLDFELHTLYTLGVTARDQNPQSLSTTAKVIVQVEDVNDHAPQVKVNALTTTGHVEISEGEPVGSFVAHVSVSDPDSGDNGKFSCSVDSPYFTIEKMYQTEYKVTTTRSLDRETTPNYDLAFVCKDSGTPAQTSTANIAVAILDENDNAPQFSKPVYSAILAEGNAKGAFITQVNATDPDLDKNSLIEYRPIGDAVNFISVNPISGNVTARVSFDFEEAETLEFLITATDHGVPSYTATTTLIMRLTDADDELPQFTQSKYVFDVYENLPLGTEVGTITASDADSPPYNQFLFAVDPKVSDTDAFVVEPQSGRIFTRQVLNREDKSQYKLVVMAISKGSPNMRSTTDVIIHIADKNDNAPIIMFPNAHNDTIHIKNRTPVGAKVTEIVATDLDIGINSDLTFTLIDGNDRDFFTMNDETGMILVKSNLQNLRDELFQLSIEVKDSGNPQHRVETVLNIVVNISSDNAMLSNQNLNIVISVAVISAVLTIVLIIAIIITKRQGTKADKQRYLSYTTGTEQQKVLVMEQGKVEASRNSELKLNKDEPGGRKEVSFSKQIDLQDTKQSSKYPALDKSTDSSYGSQCSQQPRTSGGGNGSGAGRGGGRPKAAAYYPSVHQLALNHPRPGSTSGHPGHSHLDSSIDVTPDDLQHCLNKEVDSDSTNSAALSVTDSGRGSNEDTTDCRPGVEADHAHSNTDGVILRPPTSHSDFPTRGSFKTRLNGVVQMQSAHAHPNAHRQDGGAHRTSSDRIQGHPSHPERMNINMKNNTSSEGRLKGATVFNPTIAAHGAQKHNNLRTPGTNQLSSPPGHSNSGSYGNNGKRSHGNHNKNNFHANVGGVNNSYIAEESESDWSDEEKEYVYYVNTNASHV